MQRLRDEQAGRAVLALETRESAKPSEEPSTLSEGERRLSKQPAKRSNSRVHRSFLSLPRHIV
jgi:hypothetical protein